MQEAMQPYVYAIPGQARGESRTSHGRKGAVVVEEPPTRRGWDQEGSYLIEDRFRESLTHIDGRSRLPEQQLGTIRICTRAFRFWREVRWGSAGSWRRERIPEKRPRAICSWGEEAGEVDVGAEKGSRGGS